MAKSKSREPSTKDLQEKLTKLESDINKLLEKSKSYQSSTPQETPQQETSPQENPPPQESMSTETTKSRKEILEEYEKDYLIRLEKQRQEAEAQRAAEELEAQKVTQTATSRGSMPKGWQP